EADAPLRVDFDCPWIDTRDEGLHTRAVKVCPLDSSWASAGPIELAADCVQGDVKGKVRRDEKLNRAPVQVAATNRIETSPVDLPLNEVKVDADRVTTRKQGLDPAAVEIGPSDPVVVA